MANVTVASVMGCENAAMICYEDRLITFEFWPKQLLPNKFNLAKAGFYYMGLRDECICFSCGIKLASWERDNVPFEEHKKWSPNCIFLKMVGFESTDTSDRFTCSLGASSVTRAGNFSNQPFNNNDFGRCKAWS